MVGSCTGVLGSIPKREEPGKTGAPCVKVPGSSRVPPPRSLVCGGQPSPHKPRLVVSHSTCPPRHKPLSSSPHARSFVIGPEVINTHTYRGSLGQDLRRGRHSSPCMTFGSLRMITLTTKGTLQSTKYKVYVRGGQVTDWEESHVVCDFVTLCPW